MREVDTLKARLGNSLTVGHGAGGGCSDVLTSFECKEFAIICGYDAWIDEHCKKTCGKCPAPKKVDQAAEKKKKEDKKKAERRDKEATTKERKKKEEAREQNK